MLRGSDAKRGYMRWWHSFQGVCPTTQETRTFFVEYSILNPALGTTQPILGQHPYYKRHGMKPSYVCIKAGVFPKNGDGGLQLQSYYPMTSLQVAQDPFYMQIEECVLSENRISGAIEISEDTARHPRRSRCMGSGNAQGGSLPYRIYCKCVFYGDSCVGKLLAR